MQVDVQLPLVQFFALGFRAPHGPPAELRSSWQHIALTCARSAPASQPGDIAPDSASSTQPLYWVQLQASQLKVREGAHCLHKPWCSISGQQQCCCESFCCSSARPCLTY